jgi:hypothetical protein
MGTVSFPRINSPKRGVNNTTQSSADVKERVELYINSPSVASWYVTRLTLLFDTANPFLLLFVLCVPVLTFIPLQSILFSAIIS